MLTAGSGSYNITEDSPIIIADPHYQAAPTLSTTKQTPRFRAWYWALVPALAIIAYAPALRVGFLADDYVLLFESTHPVTLQSLLPTPYWIFYRPAGMLLVWDLGGRLFGYHPLPFHIMGLLVHAAVALVLGLWAYRVTGQRGLGWLAGALVAVFPLSTEAVAWVAGQWDAWAALFGVCSLYLFTRWWQDRSRRAIYALSVVLYVLALYTKDGMLAWLPVLALSAWLVSPRMGMRELRVLALSLVPMLAALVINVGLRLATWHALGSYPGARGDYPSFFWDGLITFTRPLLSPINTEVLGAPLQQIVGACTTLLLLVGLAAFGRENRRALIMGAGWLLLTVAPALNLPVSSTDLSNNRFLYLPSAGYCFLLALLLYGAITSGKKWQRPALALAGFVLVGGVAVAWVGLRPWHTATVQVQALGQELHREVPPQSRPSGLVWYTDSAPAIYKGATVLLLGLDRLRYFEDGETLQLRAVKSVSDADLVAENRDAFALHFAYYEQDVRFHPDYIAGITSAEAPPTSEEQRGESYAAWDFRGCDASALGKWKIEGARTACKQGRGLVFEHPGDDAYMTSSQLSLEPGKSGARFVRLRVQASYPPTLGTGEVRVQWYWHAPETDWSEKASSSVAVRSDGQPHVYWTFVPTEQAGKLISALRLDPANGKVVTEVGWIAVDLVK